MKSFSIGICSLFALTALLAQHAPTAGAASIPTIDVQVLNFALNLEYLEANFYSCAAFGKPIDEELWGVGGVAPVGCWKGVFTDKSIAALAEEVAKDEIAHVRLIRSVLGNASVPQPKLDIGPAFAAAANAAASLALGRNITLKPEFSPYANDVFFLHGAFIFEDVGATAYAGAAALLVTKAYLTAAAQILAVESYHSGAVRQMLSVMQNRWAPFTQPPGLRVRDVVEAISSLRDAVDGSADTDQGVVTQAGRRYTPNIVPSDENGLIYTRNTDQVLRIVYLGGATKGGFFPDGLNGDIKAVSA